MKKVADNPWVIAFCAAWQLDAACNRMAGGADTKACSTGSVCGSEKEIPSPEGELDATRRLPSYYILLGRVLRMPVYVASWHLKIVPA